MIFRIVAALCLSMIALGHGSRTSINQMQACNLVLVPGYIIGEKAYTRFGNVASVEDCCTRCAADPSACVAFTFESSEKACYLKNTTDSNTTSRKDGTVSGQPPPPPVAASLATISAGVAHVTDPFFKSWNIDASPNREWDTRDLSNPALHYLANMSEPGYLRFGGSGNDGLRYGVGQPCQPEWGRCLNESHFLRLMDFSVAAGSRLVFGLNIQTKDSHGVWDPTDARALIKFAQSKGYTFFGFELGNEQDNSAETNFEPQALDFAVLSKLLGELYPDANTRPKIIGPDIHGFHQGDDIVTAKKKLVYLNGFAKNCSNLNVTLHALTHHEYIEVPQYAVAPASASLLDNTAQIAKLVYTGLAAVEPRIQVWAGEIGPHNGGSPNCSHSSMRWANFADVFWYVDAMASKAANGYSVFCRQDFVGIDYGIVDCATNTPLPDYYAGILWGRTMGTGVLSVAVNNSATEPSYVRVYAHCARTGNDVTVVVLNLDIRERPDVLLRVDDGTEGTAPGLALPAVVNATYYALTGPQGTNATAVSLNGRPLELDPEGKLPELSGKSGQARGDGNTLSLLQAPLPAASVHFVVLHGLGPLLHCPAA
eukprot:m.105224 g.105224  ORF g.105224 m.105224 type:complete len:597 (-) comp16856_c0_seq3:464-2254(-)